MIVVARYFLLDNTEGYSQTDLDALNAELERRAVAAGLGQLVDPASHDAALLDAISGRLLNEWDSAVLTGREAIREARRSGLTLNKHADPVEGAREGLSVEEAQQIAAEDPGLIWLRVGPA